MASDPLEKKLDQYYEDLMSKVLEVLDAQRLIMVEQKELKKDVAKIKEYVLESRSTLERIDIRTETIKENMLAFKGAEQPQTKTIARTITTHDSDSHTDSPPTSQVVKPALGSKAPTPNLKDFLSQQLAIFDVKVLNAFIKSTKEIVKTNSRIEPTFLKPIIESKTNIPIIIAGKMNLSRDKGNGSMALCFEQASAQAITRSVFMLAENAKVTDSDIKDVTSEICNQICGKSKLALKNEGYSFEIDMPEIHQGGPMELYALLGYPKIILAFDFCKCPFYVYFWG